MRRLPLPNPDRAILFALGLFLGVSALVVSLMRAGLLEPGEAGHRDRLLPADLADPQLLDESRRALDQLTQLLELPAVYEFQRSPG